MFLNSKWVKVWNLWFFKLVPVFADVPCTLCTSVGCFHSCDGGKASPARILLLGVKNYSWVLDGIGCMYENALFCWLTGTPTLRNLKWLGERNCRQSTSLWTQLNRQDRVDSLLLLSRISIYFYVLDCCTIETQILTERTLKHKYWLSCWPKNSQKHALETQSTAIRP